MSSRQLCLSILLLFPFVLSAQTFQKTYGGATDDYAYSIQHTQDGNLIMAGRSLSFGVGQYDLYLIKLTQMGDTLWTRTYGNINYDEAFHVDTTSDGGLIVCGQNSSYDWAGQLFLMKLDASGNVLWDKTYGGAIGDSDRGYAVRETSDGGFIATGSTDSYGSGNSDVYVVKTDAAGNLQWTRSIGGSSDDVGRDVIQTLTGDYYVVGYTESYGQGFIDVFFIKLSTTGLVTWAKVYGGGSYDFAYTVEQTTDGGFVLGATTDSYGQGNMEAMMIKTDVNGNIQWAKAYGNSGEDRAQVARQTADGGYIMAGRTNSFGGGNYDSYLVKTDSAGNLAWDIAQGGTSWDQAWDVQQMADGGYVVAGYTLSYGQGGREAYIYRTDSDGQSNCNEATATATVATAITLQSTNAGVSSSGGSVDDPPTAIRTGTIIGVQCESNTGICPQSIFAGSTTEICKGDTVHFTNQSIDATSYQWFVDGLLFSSGTDTSYAFETSGTSTVSLIAITATCSDTSQVDITIDLPPTVDAGDDQLICTGSSVLLNGTYGNADGVVWSASGTGQFNDSSIVNSIYSHSIQDELAGSVTLFLTTSLSGPCPAVVDSVLITIDQCVGIPPMNNRSRVELQRFDLLGRPVGKEYSGIQFILFQDGTVRKQFVRRLR